MPPKQCTIRYFKILVNNTWEATLKVNFKNRMFTSHWKLSRAGEMMEGIQQKRSCNSKSCSLYYLQPSFMLWWKTQQSPCWRSQISGRFISILSPTHFSLVQFQILPPTFYWPKSYWLVTLMQMQWCRFQQHVSASSSHCALVTWVDAQQEIHISSNSWTSSNSPLQCMALYLYWCKYNQ